MRDEPETPLDEFCQGVICDTLLEFFSVLEAVVARSLLGCRIEAMDTLWFCWGFSILFRSSFRVVFEH